jgi:hypothetical protein
LRSRQGVGAGGISSDLEHLVVLGEPCKAGGMGRGVAGACCCSVVAMLVAVVVVVITVITSSW